MVTTASDISIVLSGGSTNTDPNDSIGGSPSSTPLSSLSLNNLFDDVTAEEQEVTHEDYRCFYIFNDGDSTIYSLKLWILEEQSGGGTVELGIRTFSEIQRITISPIPTSGQMTLSYEGIQFVSNANSDVAVWATEIEDNLNSLVDGSTALLREVSVTAQTLPDQVVFDIDYSGGLGGLGHDDKKDHALISHVSDTLNNSAEVSIVVLQEGSPVNSIAQIIDNENVPPANVGFFRPTENSPISLVRLVPEEGFPVWVKRVVPADAEAIENDGVTFRLRSNSLDPYA